MSMLAMAAAILPFAQSAIVEIERAEQERLNACIEQVDEDAEQAYEDSLRWLGEGARPAARYCNALAIIGLGNYKEGAARLEELANAPDAGGESDRALYLAQSGNAWVTAGYPDAAVTTLSFNPTSECLLFASKYMKRALRVAHVPQRSIFTNWPTSKTPLGYVQCCAFSPSSAHVAVGNDQGKVLLYQLNHYS